MLQPYQTEHRRKNHPADLQPWIDTETNHVCHVVIETVATC